MKLLVNGKECEVGSANWSGDSLKIVIDSVDYEFNINELDKMVKGLAPDRKKGHVLVNGQDLFIEPLSKKNRNQAAEAGAMISPMPGKIFKIVKEVGQTVKKGDTILIMEAMKMEHPVKASSDGVIKNIFFQEGQQVDGGVELVSIDAEKE